MIQGLHVSMSGALAAQRGLDVSANNVANINTPGFKASRTENQTQAGGGVKVSATKRLTYPGGVETTGLTLDLAIQGDGYFTVRTPEGIKYTRSGAFQVGSDGRLVDAGGNPLQPEIVVPQGTTDLFIGGDGSVLARTGAGEAQNLGRIGIATFQNELGLRAEGGNLLSATPASGQPIGTFPGVNGAGSVIAGALEMSNTDLAREITSQIVSKNVFMANIRALKQQDETIGELFDRLG